MILLGFDEEAMPCRSALRSIGFLLRSLEEAPCALGLPTSSGEVVRDGVTLGYEQYGDPSATDRPTILLLPTWTIIHARFWKLQVPYLARHFPVVAYDGPGNGRSDRTTDPSRYTGRAYAARRGRRRSTRAASNGPWSSACRSALATRSSWRRCGPTSWPDSC